jgi:hypothetical protein
MQPERSQEGRWSGYMGPKVPRSQCRGRQRIRLALFHGLSLPVTQSLSSDRSIELNQCLNAKPGEVFGKVTGGTRHVGDALNAFLAKSVEAED